MLGVGAAAAAGKTVTKIAGHEVEKVEKKHRKAKKNRRIGFIIGFIMGLLLGAGTVFAVDHLDISLK